MKTMILGLPWYNGYNKVKVVNLFLRRQRPLAYAHGVPSLPRSSVTHSSDTMLVKGLTPQPYTRTDVA